MLPSSDYTRAITCCLSGGVTGLAWAVLPAVPSCRVFNCSFTDNPCPPYSVLAWYLSHHVANHRPGTWGREHSPRIRPVAEPYLAWALSRTRTRRLD